MYVLPTWSKESEGVAFKGYSTVCCVMRVELLLFFFVLLTLCSAELDIEVIVLDDKSYNSTKFIDAVAEFNPIVIVNGTEIPLLGSKPGRPGVRINGFINPVLCVNGSCYREEDLLPPPPPPAATPIPGETNMDVAVVASVSVAVALVLVWVMCCFLGKRKQPSLGARFRRVVIRERIDLSALGDSKLAHQIVKTGSKHTRGFV
jgi:hypothetical protein